MLQSLHTRLKGAVTAPFSASGNGDGLRIRFEDVSVRYGATTVLSNLSMCVNPGEIVALLGPSGSGKTTALRTVSGFVTPTKGRVFIGERDVTHVAPSARNIGMVVQNYALFPHMSVAENVAFGLRARRAERRQITARVAESLALVGMEAFARRMPQALSGGQQQRVAIARALAIRPDVLLLDEPLSALDAQIRRQMVQEIARLHSELPGLTILYVTHDQHEALTLADRIAILRDGRLCALAPARSLYRRPPNRFSAEFLGSANVLEGRVCAHSEDGKTAEVAVGPHRLRGANLESLRPGDPALICLRPHHLSTAPTTAGAGWLEGRVTHVDWQGATETLTLRLDGAELRVTMLPTAEPPAIGAKLTLFYDPFDATILPHEPNHG